MKNKRLFAVMVVIILLVIAGLVVFMVTDKKEEKKDPEVKDRKTLVYVSGDDERLAQLVPMLGRNEQTVLRIQIVCKLTHQHGFLLLSGEIFTTFPHTSPHCKHYNTLSWEFQ